MPNYEPGWSVGYRYDGQTSWLPIRFGREIDAQMGRDAIAGIIEWDGEPLDVARRLQEFGVKDVKRLMVEAMQW